MQTACWLAFGGLVVWLAVLCRHEEQVKFIHYVSTGERFGCDWTWANPQELGQSMFFSVPAVQSLRTGQITEYPLMG